MATKTCGREREGLASCFGALKKAIDEEGKRTEAWMGGWMDGSMDRWTDGWKDGCQ